MGLRDNRNNDYPIEAIDDEAFSFRCSSCKRSEEYIGGYLDRHVMGCVYRTRQTVVLMWEEEQERKRLALEKWDQGVYDISRL
jgi:hypothetical protein